MEYVSNFVAARTFSLPSVIHTAGTKPLFPQTEMKCDAAKFRDVRKKRGADSVEEKRHLTISETFKLRGDFGDAGGRDERHLSVPVARGGAVATVI